MAGTKKGGHKAANTIRLRHGRDFYVNYRCDGWQSESQRWFC